MKIVIVMTYFDRQFQLNKTLETIGKTEHKNFEVIIVDDCSSDPPHIGIGHFPIDVYRTNNKRWLDGSPAYNQGIIEALKRKPDIIILQNAETYHVGDILSYANEKVTDKNYISFGCYNLSKEWTIRQHDINRIIHDFNNHAVNNDDNAWLNHCAIRPMGYHWCSAIKTENLKRMNGFDERFSDGYCFEDDEFLSRVKMLGLKVDITCLPFVVHQWHDRSYVPKNWHELFEINRNLFDHIRAEGDPVAKHNFTENINV